MNWYESQERLPIIVEMIDTSFDKTRTLFVSRSDKSEQGVVSQARCNTNSSRAPEEFPWSSVVELCRQAREQNALRRFRIRVTF